MTTLDAIENARIEAQTRLLEANGILAPDVICDSLTLNDSLLTYQTLGVGGRDPNEAIEITGSHYETVATWRTPVTRESAVQYQAEINRLFPRNEYLAGYADGYRDATLDIRRKR